MQKAVSWVKIRFSSKLAPALKKTEKKTSFIFFPETVQHMLTSWLWQPTNSSSQEHTRWQCQRTTYSNTSIPQLQLSKLRVNSVRLQVNSVEHYLILAHTDTGMPLLSPSSFHGSFLQVPSLLEPHCITQRSWSLLQVWKAAWAASSGRLLRTMTKKNAHIRDALGLHQFKRIFKLLIRFHISPWDAPSRNQHQNWILNTKNKEFIKFLYVNFRNIYDNIPKDHWASLLLRPLQIWVHIQRWFINENGMRF